MSKSCLLENQIVLRLAGSFTQTEGDEVPMFSIGEKASCAAAGQKVTSFTHDTVTETETEADCRCRI